MFEYVVNVGVAIVRPGSFGWALACLLGQMGIQVVVYVRDPEKASRLQLLCTTDPDPWLTSQALPACVQVVHESCYPLCFHDFTIVAPPFRYLSEALSAFTWDRRTVLVAIQKGMYENSVPLEIAQQQLGDIRCITCVGAATAQNIVEKPFDLIVVPGNSSSHDAAQAFANLFLMRGGVKVFDGLHHRDVGVMFMLRTVYSYVQGFLHGLHGFDTDFRSVSQEIWSQRLLLELQLFAEQFGVSEDVRSFSHPSAKVFLEDIHLCSQPCSRNYLAGYQYAQRLSGELVEVVSGTVEGRENFGRFIGEQLSEGDLYFLDHYAPLHMLLLRAQVSDGVQWPLIFLRDHRPTWFGETKPRTYPR